MDGNAVSSSARPRSWAACLRGARLLAVEVVEDWLARLLALDHADDAEEEHCGDGGADGDRDDRAVFEGARRRVGACLHALEALALALVPEAAEVGARDVHALEVVLERLLDIGGARRRRAELH